MLRDLAEKALSKSYVGFGYTNEVSNGGVTFEVPSALGKGFKVTHQILTDGLSESWSTMEKALIDKAELRLIMGTIPPADLSVGGRKYSIPLYLKAPGSYTFAGWYKDYYDPAKLKIDLKRLLTLGDLVPTAHLAEVAGGFFARGLLKSNTYVKQVEQKLDKEFAGDPKLAQYRNAFKGMQAEINKVFEDRFYQSLKTLIGRSGRTTSKFVRGDQLTAQMVSV